MKKNYYLLLLLFIACISHAQTVSISSSAAPSNTICAGTNVTFTANISGFTNPSYKWYVNGTEISGAISSAYSSTSLTNGAQVYVKVTGASADGAIVTDGLRFNLDAGKSASYAGTGTTWTDLSGNGNHGTLAGSTLPVYNSDNGGSFVFNGSTSNVNLNKNATEIGIYDNSYTADAWVYPTDLSGDRGMFGDEQAVQRKGLHLIFRGGSIHQGHFGSDANAGSVTANSWWHIVFTFDKSNGSTRIYKNGVYQGNGEIGSYIGTTNIHLGQAYNNTGFFHGKGAVYKMYNRVLSAAEVATNYNALKDRFSSNGVNSNSNIITTTVNAGPAIPVITVTGDACVNKTTLSTPAGFTYAWYKDNVLIPSSNVRTYSPTIAGDYKVQVTSGSCSNQSTATTISTCGVTADGRMRSIATPTTLVSQEGGVNFGTGVSEAGATVNATGISTTLGTIGATTAVVSGVISSTNARTTSIGVIYSTDSNFGTYSTSSTQSNVASGTHVFTLSGLSSTTTYHAKSFIVNIAGTSYGPAVSFTTTTPPIEVGNSYGGGLVFYIFQSGDPGYVAGETHGLIASPSDQAIYTDWKNNGGFTDIATGTGIGTGLANTNAIISSHGSSASYAAGFARAYNGGGYTDWYLPSRDELYKMHISIGQGANNIAQLVRETYWSSSQSDSYQAYYMFAQSGNITTVWKDWGKAVRAIRTF
jgi:hypothetical protein